MAINLISPGVQVSVIDESAYSPNGIGTTPLIVIATAQDKTNPSGNTATGTTMDKVGTVYNVTSQRELTNYFGMPNFPYDVSGNRIYGDERCEYGLHAAYNVLDTIGSAYIVRADIDLNQLAPSFVRPTASAAGGTLWLDTASTSWGVFEWDATNQSFARVTPTYLTDSSKLSADVPIASYGSIGDYTVVGTLISNPLYYKNYLNNWVLVGSTAWQLSSAPAVTASTANVGNLVNDDTFKINGTTITIANASASTLATQINALNAGAGITGVKAAIVNGYFTLFVSSLSKSDGSVTDGKVKIENLSGTTLTKLGIVAGTYNGPTTQYSKHSTVPSWKSITATTARPSGSVWIKTTNFNYGANYTTYRRNAISSTWDLVPNLLFGGPIDALYQLDPVKGGLNIPLNTLYTQYAAQGGTYASTSVTNAPVASRTYYRYETSATNITGNVSNPTLTATNSFSILASKIGSLDFTNYVTITVPASPNNTAAGIAALISAANISQNNNVLVSANVDSSGRLTITHTAGGSIYLTDVSGHPLSDLGFSSDSTGVEVVQLTLGTDSLHLSNWALASDLIAQPTEPTALPETGTIWYYPKTEADILINSGHTWKGYRNVTSDVRGYNLHNTDPNGPIFSTSEPSQQSDGTALVYGDLWIDTSSMDDYPMIYRWQRVNGTDMWQSLDTTDYTDENGLAFADVRWDTDGTSDVATDDITPISALLISDYTDLDAPDAALYPEGCLLFNTRRSGYNVKKYVPNYFNINSFPSQSLPEMTATWQSYSGKKWNGNPYFGRQAQRSVVVSAMQEAVNGNDALREEGKTFNILCAPGYIEMLESLKTLNDDRKNTGFIISEAPMGLSTDPNTIASWATNNGGIGVDGEVGLVSGDSYTAVFYPGTVIMNPVSGVGNIAVPMSTAMLRTFVRSDQIGEQWFAPAGTKRGIVDNALAIGYIDRNKNNVFVPTGVPQALRDLLYVNHINPVTFFPGVGIMNYGNHTRQNDTTALDRINVARLVCYLRSNVERLMRPFVFEPNDKTTRDTVKSLIDKLLIDITSRRGLYDHLVVCDGTNNTPDTINRNELHIDIAIEPVKAVEFIYIPVRLKATGQIGSTLANA